jgi:hypothetical protein
MERVEFVSVESGDDLTVSFVRGHPTDPDEIRSLILSRTPKYEFALDDSERGVSVSDEDCDEDESDLLKEIEFQGDEVRIVSRNADYLLECSRVDPEELEDAKKILHAMNFDGRFKIHTR